MCVKVILKLLHHRPETKRGFGFEEHLSEKQLLFSDQFIARVKQVTQALDSIIKNLATLHTSMQPKLYLLGCRHARFQPMGFKVL